MTRPARAGLAVLALLAVVAGCAREVPEVSSSAAVPTPTPTPTPTASPTPAASPVATTEWAHRTLARLSLREKAAQMIGVRLTGLLRDPQGAEAKRGRDRVVRLEAGTAVVFDADPATLRDHLDRLQREAPLGVLVAADMERGLSFRVHRGVVPLPFAMAVGATRSEDAARFMGELAAREGRALGIHWAFAPVADVNNNPANPVINIRSFGEDPELVARLSAAFVSGARSGGLLTTAKHFPGHGDTSVDTHLRLATLSGDRARLDAVELRPFKAAVEAGVDWVMLGHIAAPALDPSGTPATLSPAMVDMLRRDLGFRGLLVTDGMDMAGVDPAWNREAVVRAVQAGADLILLPPDAADAVRSLVRAVEEGRVTEERLDASVRRILETKERLGLHHPASAGAATPPEPLDRTEDMERALAIARASVTVVRNEKDVLPLRPRRLRVLHLVLSSDARNPAIRGIPERELRNRGVDAETVSVGPELSPAAAADLVNYSRAFTHVMASCFARVTGRKGTAEMARSQASLLRALAATGRPLVVVSFASPYLLRQFPEVGVYVAAYGPAESSQRAAIAALFGEYKVVGKLPVSLPGLYPYGHGLALGSSGVTAEATPAKVLPGSPFAAADAVVEAAVAARAFPGAVLAVGRDKGPLHLRAFGRLTYGDGAPAAAVDTVYDLASLTKIVATTTAAMILVDEGKLDLAKPVSAYVPEFRGAGKDQVLVANLLTHSAGFPARKPFFKEASGKEAILQRICATDLDYPPGTRSLYSDLDMILMGEVIERAAGEPFGSFVEQKVLRPLGMTSTGFKPNGEVLARVAPTEVDPWRGRLLRGEVHDENAFAMGGIAGHAGLFGTAADVARFAEMMMRGGTLGGERRVAAKTVESFTRRASVPGSTYGLGFDTPAASDDAPRTSVPGRPGYSSAGSLLSARTFGHTGFTGTSLWVDPVKRVFVILLTNRVHPDRNNDAIRVVRAEVADAVARELR